MNWDIIVYSTIFTEIAINHSQYTMFYHFYLNKTYYLSLVLSMLSDKFKETPVKSIKIFSSKIIFQ